MLDGALDVAGLDRELVEEHRAALQALVDGWRGGLAPIAIAVWGLAVGRVLERGPTGALIHLTGTYVAAGAACEVSAAYRARAALAGAVGAGWEWGVPGRNGHRPRNLRVAPEARAGAGLLAGELARAGLLPAPAVRPVLGAATLDGGALVEGSSGLGAGRHLLRCPGHDDRTPSLSVLLHADRTGGARCHAAGCGRRYAIRPSGASLVAFDVCAAPKPVPEVRAPSGSGRRNKTRSPPGRRGLVPEPEVLSGRVERPPGRVAMVLPGPGRKGWPRFGALADSERAARGVRFSTEKARTHAEDTLEQRYESVGWKAPGPGDWRQRPDGRWWPCGYSVAQGTDRVVIDLDGLDVGTDPDGWDPGLPRVQAAARELAKEDPRLRGIDLLATGPDGVQARLLLARICSAEEERELYADPETREWLRMWAEWLREELGRGGEIDESVWRAGGFCRSPGWRWSKRCGSMFLARFADEGGGVSKYRGAAAEYRAAAREAKRAGRPVPSQAPAPDPDAVHLPGPVAAGPPNPHPARMAEEIAAKIGGRVWIREERIRVYFGDEWVECQWPSWDRGARAVVQGRLLFSGLDGRREEIQRAAHAAGPLPALVDGPQAHAWAEKLGEALGGTPWHRGEVHRIYFGGDRDRWLDVRAPNGLVVASTALEPFLARRAVGLVREWRGVAG